MANSQIIRKRRPRWALSSYQYCFCLEGILITSLFIASYSFAPTFVFKSIQQYIHSKTILPMGSNKLLFENIQSCLASSRTASSFVCSQPRTSMILNFSEGSNSAGWRKNLNFGLQTPHDQSTLLHMTRQPAKASKDVTILGFDVESTLIDSSIHKSSCVLTIDAPLEVLQEGQYMSEAMKIKNDFETLRKSINLRRSLQRMIPLRTYRRFAYSPIKKTNLSGGGFSNQQESMTNKYAATIEASNILQNDGPQQSPLWLPYLPSRSQIQELKWMELRAACQERGLPTNGKKADLVNRFLAWSNEQQIRRVFERNNAFEAYLSSSILLDKAYKTEGGDIKAKDATNDSIEPLINRRKFLLLSRDRSKLSTYLSRNSQSTYKQSFVDSTEAILGENSTRQRIKRAKTTPIQDKDEDISLKTLTPTKEYLSLLNRSFYESSFPSNKTRITNNYQIQQLYLRAKYSDQAGDLDTAKRILEELRLVAPHDLRVVRRLARLETQKGNFIEARSILLKSLDSFPKESHLLQGLGTLEVKCGNRDLARGYFKEAIKNSPTFPNPYHALATLEHSCGNIRLATSVLRLGLKNCPSNHRLHHAMGDLYREAMMLDLAENSYRKGLDCIASQTGINGKNLNWAKSFFYLSLSYIAFEKEDKVECRRWLKKSFSADVNDVFSQGWIALAKLEESEGNVDNARSTYKEAASKYEYIRKTKALRLASVDENVQDIESLSPLRMSDRWTHLYTSWAKFEETYGSYDEANNVYSRAMDAFPHDISMLLSWAKFQAKSKRYDRARTLFEVACDKASCNSADPYRLYAEFEMRIGNYKRARSIFYLGAQSLSESSNGALSLNQNFAQLFMTWAILEWHLGNFERTEVLFDNALRLTKDTEEGLELRSLLLYSIARFLHHARRDYPLAQHCICLCLKDKCSFRNKVDVWNLWSQNALAMKNKSVSQSCLREADDLIKAKIQLNDIPRLDSKDMQQLLRRAPWDSKTLTGTSEACWYEGIRFPDMV